MDIPHPSDIKRALAKVSCCFLCLALLSQGPVTAIVIRHDVSDSKYQARATEFPGLAYLPGEGHGALIASDWVVTAAHATAWRPIHNLIINGITRTVEKVIIHPGYKAPPKKLQSGDAAPLIAFLGGSDDLALIKLEQPVTDVTPIEMYQGSDEKGQVVEIIGAGATGNGLVGQYPHSAHRGELRRCEARVSGTDERWLELRFERPPTALPSEGMPADGDSGAPVLISVNGRRELAGLVSHKFADGELSKFRCCFYGQITYQVRISHYADWIEAVISSK